LKSKRLEHKTGPVGRWVVMKRERVSEEGEAGKIRSMYFIYLYESRTMKIIETILSRGEG
jgi:hypothetical protein